MPFFPTQDGTQIFFHDWGQGRPVVLLHGWPLNADSWEYQSVRLVEAGFRVVAPDRRGFGRSAQPWSGYDYATMGADVAALIEHLDLHDVVLAGFSMGGGEVAQVAGSASPRVGKAAFISAVTPFMLKTDDHDGADASVFEGMVDGLRDDRQSFFSKFGKMFYGHTLLGRAAVPEPVLHHFFMMAMMASPHATTQCVEAFSRTDLRHEVGSIKVPTLIIHGSSDKTVPLEASSARTVKLIAGSRLEVYDGAPHALVLTDAERFNKDVLAFAG